MGDGGGSVAVIDLLEAATPQQDAGGRDEPAHAMGEAVNDTAIQQRYAPRLHPACIAFPQVRAISSANGAIASPEWLMLIALRHIEGHHQ